MNRRRPSPTPEQNAEALRLVSAGGHPTDIAKLLGMGKSNVEIVARKHGIRTTSMPLEELKKLHETKPHP